MGFPWEIVTGIPQAISGAVQGKKNREAQREENALNRTWSKEQRDQQNTWNLEQWNRGNQYDSPREQMARLEAAGLNPNLVYGNGAQSQAVSSPQASTAASGLQQKVKPKQVGQVGSVVQAGLTAMMQKAQIKNINEETDKTALANRQERIMQGLDPADVDTSGEKDDYSNNISYVQKYNEAMQSATRLKIEKLKLTEQKYLNAINQVKSLLATEHGIIANGNSIATAILAAMAKGGISISDIIQTVIKQFSPSQTNKNHE